MRMSEYLPLLAPKPDVKEERDEEADVRCLRCLILTSCCSRAAQYQSYLRSSKPTRIVLLCLCAKGAMNQTCAYNNNGKRTRAQRLRAHVAL